MRATEMRAVERCQPERDACISRKEMVYSSIPVSTHSLKRAFVMDFDDLKNAIESQHGGTAIRLQTVPVRETLDGTMVWEGAVHVFALVGHPKAARAYAWSSPIAGSDKRQYFAVLHMGGITCPQEAVRAVLAAEREQRSA